MKNPKNVAKMDAIDKAVAELGKKGKPPLPADLDEALLAAQRLMPMLAPEVRVELGTKYKYSHEYIGFEQMLELVARLMNPLGIRMRQEASVSAEGVYGVETVWRGYGREERSGVVMVVAQASKPHDCGSAITYAKRYSLGLALGIASDPDDDALEAESATAAAPPAATAAWPKPPAKAATAPSASGPQDVQGLFLELPDGKRIGAMNTTLFFASCRQHIGKAVAAGMDDRATAIYSASRDQIHRALEGTAVDEVREGLTKMIAGFEPAKESENATAS